MNKYIKTDIEQGIQYLKIGIMNALSDLETGEEEIIRFNVPIPLQLIVKCAEDRGWIDDHEDDFTNGWDYDYWYRMISPDEKRCLHIYGSLLCGNTSIHIINNED